MNHQGAQHSSNHQYLAWAKARGHLHQRKKPSQCFSHYEYFFRPLSSSAPSSSSTFSFFCCATRLSTYSLTTGTCECQSLSLSLCDISLAPSALDELFLNPHIVLPPGASGSFRHYFDTRNPSCLFIKGTYSTLFPSTGY